MKQKTATWTAVSTKDFLSSSRFMKQGVTWVDHYLEYVIINSNLEVMLPLCKILGISVVPATCKCMGPACTNIVFLSFDLDTEQFLNRKVSQKGSLNGNPIPLNPPISELI